MSEPIGEKSDWELIEQAREGDMDAFSVLVRRYERPIIHFTQRMVGTRGDAEDIAQETFIRVYRYLAKLKPDAKFSTLLFGISRNLALNFIRDSGRRGRGKTQSLTREDDTDMAVEDNRLRPDRSARLQEIEELIELGLSRLSTEHREVLVLRELEGQDYETISKILGCRKGTVKSRIARAREQLRRHLHDLGADLS